MKFSSPEAEPSRTTTSGGEPYLSLSEIWRSSCQASPSWGTTLVIKLGASLGARWIMDIQGEKDYLVGNDPFILVLNHSQKLEAIALPSILMHLRSGNLIHFLADWNYCLVPGVWFFYRFGQVITVARKPAKPRFLNVFKPLFVGRDSGFARASRVLEAGRSIGLFPEGTINRDPERLLPGQNGAAMLSLRHQVPILPLGVRFPGHDPSRPLTEFIPCVIKIGEPIRPPHSEGKPRLTEIRRHHRRIMEAIAVLSGKIWQPRRGRSA